MSHVTCWAYDCRHGRALLKISQSSSLLVWNPMTTEEHHLPLPTLPGHGCFTFNAAVLCAAGHADHDHCHSSPFLVVFVFSDLLVPTTCAWIYSSETGVWGEITSTNAQNSYVKGEPTVLVGNTLYCMLDGDSIIGFDLDNHSLDLVEKVPYDYHKIIIIPTQDGLLGSAGVHGVSLHFWARVASIDGVVLWTHRRVIDLEKLIGPRVFNLSMLQVGPVGYAEYADVIFIRVYPSTYMIHLKSLKIEEVSEKGIEWFVFPYTSFYSPGITIGGGDAWAEVLNST